MNEKTEQAAERQLAKKERFEFVFTINGNIICQRYFHINGFKSKSLYSSELKDSFKYCVNLIKNDLATKSKIFLWYTAPQIFDSKEQMDEWVKQPRWKLEVPSFILLKDTKEVYVWDGTSVERYEGSFNTSEYLPTEEETPCVLKLAFYDNGKEVISEVWDGNTYPRFVRSNIDLSNSKNKYEGNGIWAPYESILIKLMIQGQHDLIPQIVKELCICCSYESDSDYTINETYGDKTYKFNVGEDWKRYVSSLEVKYQKKTEEYQKTLY